MKIRNGFVSNSSSSSFICSTSMDLEKVRQKLETMLNNYNDLFEDSLKFDEVFEEPFRISGQDAMSREYKDHIFSWIFQKNGRCWITGVEKIDDLDGKLIINSAGDNSVPWELVDTIEKLFEGQRVHLG